MLRAYTLFFLLVLSCTAWGQTLPSKSEILSDLNKVNEYYMDAFPETKTISTGEPNWLEGSYFNGHLALFDLHPTSKNIEYAKQWATHNSWNIGNKPHEADNQCVGQAYMDLYYAYGAKDDYMLEKVGTSVRNLVNRAAVNDWDWIDALYMAMPVLTRYGVYNSDDNYFEKLYAMYKSTQVSQKLYNSSTGLWYRDAKVLQGKKCGCYWARGNGWVFGAHVRTLKYLPKEDAHREEYIQTFQKMAAKLKAIQRNDGFWNVSLTNPNYYGGPETSGTGFFVYGIAWGINNGILDKETYLPVVVKGWNGLSTIALQSNGRVGYAQGVADEPKDAQPVTASSSRHYGEGNFLLAGTEVIKLAEGDLPLPNEFFVKAVTMTSASTLKVTFYEQADTQSAKNITNYSLNKGGVVETAILSNDGLSCELTLSNITNGAYGISFKNIKSVSGKTIADASGKYIMVEPIYSGVKDAVARVNTIEIYPNPTHNGEINIGINVEVKGAISCKLFNLSGKMLLSKQGIKMQHQSSYPLSLQGIAKGIYVLQLTGNGVSCKKKVVVN